MLVGVVILAFFDILVITVPRIKGSNLFCTLAAANLERRLPAIRMDSLNFILRILRNSDEFSEISLEIDGRNQSPCRKSAEIDFIQPGRNIVYNSLVSQQNLPDSENRRAQLSGENISTVFFTAGRLVFLVPHTKRASEENTSLGSFSREDSIISFDS